MTAPDSISAAADVDERVVFKRRDWGRVRHLGEFGRFLRRLRAQHWDWVIDFQGLFRTGLCTWYASRRGATEPNLRRRLFPCRSAIRLSPGSGFEVRGSGNRL